MSTSKHIRQARQHKREPSDIYTPPDLMTDDELNAAWVAANDDDEQENDDEPNARTD